MAKSTFPWQQTLAQHRYLADHGLSLMVSLAVQMNRPLLLEGPAGSGKTALAYAMAHALDREMIRLSCYEGIDAQMALYDWNYHRQMAAIAQNHAVEPFSPEFLLERPLLRALNSAGAVLLIDEIDRADEAFEALVLEYLSEYQMSIPEWKTIAARVPPVTVLTSNRQRPLSDALRRRCLYAYVDWPDFDRELRIAALHVPSLPDDIRVPLVQAVRCLRGFDLIKPPGLSETIDWARAQDIMGSPGLNRQWIEETLGCVIKDARDLSHVLGRVEELLTS